MHLYNFFGYRRRYSSCVCLRLDVAMQLQRHDYLLARAQWHSSGVRVAKDERDSTGVAIARCRALAGPGLATSWPLGGCAGTGGFELGRNVEPSAVLTRSRASKSCKTHF
jgi:hypothetical protein